MKKIVLVCGLAALLTATACRHDTVQLETKTDSVSWVLGASYGISLLESGQTINKEVLLQALASTLNEEKAPLTMEQYQTLLDNLNAELAMQQHQQMKQEQASNEQDENAYFARLVAENPNVKQAKEGFYYEVLTPGKGANAKFRNVVTFDYRSYFAKNNQIYDQTYGNREPINHVVGNPMFQGLQEAFTYMNAGSKYRFYFPSNKAFGAQGDVQNGIPPFSTMIYEIELHAIR